MTRSGVSTCDTDAKAKQGADAPEPFPFIVDQETVDSIRQAAMRADMNPVGECRKLNCTFYNDCLDAAIEADWPGFTCTYCKAYQVITQDQQEQDLEGFVAMNEAAERVEASYNEAVAKKREEGKETNQVLGAVGRKRGVKGGAENKKYRQVRLNVIKDKVEVEVPPALVLP